jgi:diguanylate cyclase (GGDEF)-like protein
MRPARLLLNLLVPCAVLVAAWLAAPALSTLPPSLAGLRLYGAWALIALGIVVALAFRRGRIVFALLTLAAAHAAYTLLLANGLNGAPARGVFAALCLLVPLNLAALCVLSERGSFNMHGARRLAVLTLEAACAAWLALGASGDVIARLYAPLFEPALVASPVPHGGLIALALAFAICCGVWLARRSPLDLGFAGAAAAVAIALHRIAAPQAFTLFVAAAALLLLIALLQDTFRMAFRDELTGLPSRRDLNERLMGLGRNYMIAMLDVDHFKKFNDTYGHDVGDQVLKMVAAKMAAVGGGGTAYRYGGEEFTVLFAGRDVEHALPHLEALRREIEQHRLALRAADRPARSKTGKQRRGATRAAKSVAVTISIGVAARNERLATPAAVIRAADNALYRAKRGGRNQISR